MWVVRLYSMMSQNNGSVSSSSRWPGVFLRNWIMRSLKLLLGCASKKHPPQHPIIGFIFVSSRSGHASLHVCDWLNTWPAINWWVPITLRIYKYDLGLIQLHFLWLAYHRCHMTTRWHWFPTPPHLAFPERQLAAPFMINDTPKAKWIYTLKKRQLSFEEMNLTWRCAHIGIDREEIIHVRWAMWDKEKRKSSGKVTLKQ